MQQQPVRHNLRVDVAIESDEGAVDRLERLETAIAMVGLETRQLLCHIGVGQRRGIPSDREQFDIAQQTPNAYQQGVLANDAATRAFQQQQLALSAQAQTLKAQMDAQKFNFQQQQATIQNALASQRISQEDARILLSQTKAGAAQGNTNSTRITKAMFWNTLSRGIRRKSWKTTPTDRR